MSAKASDKIVTDMVSSNDFGTQCMHGLVLYQCHNVLPVLNT